MHVFWGNYCLESSTYFVVSGPSCEEEGGGRSGLRALTYCFPSVVFANLYMCWVNVSDLFLASASARLLKRWAFELCSHHPPFSGIGMSHPLLPPRCLFVAAVCVPVTHDQTSSVSLSVPSHQTYCCQYLKALCLTSSSPSWFVSASAPLLYAHWHLTP